MHYGLMWLVFLTLCTFSSPLLDNSKLGWSPTWIPQVPGQGVTTPRVAEIYATGTEPVFGHSYFSIETKCRSDRRNLEGGKFKNRWDFYEQAIKDAHVIAAAATKWPQVGTDVSDLYLGLHIEDPNLGYVYNIVENLKAARDWGKDEWGFDPYITLTCSDPFNACKNKVDGDPRSIACYVNNTSTWNGGIWSRISCCGPFFTTSTNYEIYEQNKGKDKDSLSLSWMRTSGSYLYHEMMHTVKITGKRPKIVDERFKPEDSPSQKRIYGPKDCAKAANLYGGDKTATNADSYATFALAMFWKDVFQGKVPRPAIEDGEMPPSFVDLISDNDLNYKAIPEGTVMD